MAEKGENKILAIITICIMLISIGLSGCVGDDDSNHTAKKEDLELKIYMDEQDFSNTSSDINIEVILKNLKNKPVYIEKGFDLGDNLYLELFLPTNISMKPAIDYVDKLPKKVELNNEKKLKINLKELFFYEDNPSIYYDWNVTGEYNVQLSYRSYYMKETLFSNKLEFKIE